MPQYVIEREIPGAGNLSDAEVQAVAKKIGRRAEGDGTGDQVAP